MTLRPLRIAPALALAALMMPLSACYSPALTDGAQQCSADGKCADGYTCQANKHCYKSTDTYDCSPACTGGLKCDKTHHPLACVECITSDDCGAGEVCTQSRTCAAGCSFAHPQCLGDAGSCDVDGGVCRGCNADSECTTAGLTRCDLSSGHCVQCLPGMDTCPLGQFCTGMPGATHCAAGCKKDADCNTGGKSGQLCCNNLCSDPTSDGKNCGKCGNACGAGKTCCASACTDTATDLANCGMCGGACNPQNATGPMCATSKCGYAMCNKGFGDCNMITGDGCEVQTDTDVKNCGTCGNLCGPVANAAPGCMAGACTAVCSGTFLDCNGMYADGCEVDGSNDANNCGSCGHACPAAANATPSCTASACGFVCKGTFRDCNKKPADGCEANILTDTNNCGVCGTVCTAKNAVTKCNGGSCAIGMCNAGFGDCNMNYADGCETPINVNDNNNCGGCGKVCPMGQACTMGVCMNTYPAACSTGNDVDGSAYTICAMDATGAWISGQNVGGCSFHAQDICKKYGFTKVTRWGGTCGNICGYCGVFTCAMPQGKYVQGGAYTTFDGGGGNPAGGAAIGCTVHWECAP